ncbi:MAG: hypothetical protein EBU08_09070, partial [Micrococcales bacterium]|nr:hypothetical protein [Micrococcales bacterium]
MRRFATTVLATIALLIGGLGLQPASADGYPPCTITGTAAGETITGTEGNDVICTGGGNDTVNALGGNDIIIVSGSGIDTINGGSGNDTIDASLGTDSTIDAGSGDDTVYGTSGDDEITAGDGADTVDGNAGDDLISGGEGSDNLSGDTGNDTIAGEVGNDTVSGEVGNDKLAGGDGSDLVDGGLGINVCEKDISDSNLFCTYLVTFNVLRSSLLSGRVLSSDGVPLSGVAASVSNFEGGLVSATTDSEGRFSLVVSSGNWILGDNWYFSLQGTDSVDPKLPTSWSIKSYAGNLLDLSKDVSLDFVLPAVKRIKIQVKDSNGNAIQGATASPNGIAFEDNFLIQGKHYGVTTFNPLGNQPSDSQGNIYIDSFSQLNYVVTIQLEVSNSQSSSNDPESVMASSTKTSSTSLSWPAVISNPKVTNYLVDVSTDGNTWVPVSKRVSTSTSLGLSGLRLGTTYQVRVAAVNAAGTGAYVYGSFTTLATVSTSPTVLVSSNVSGSRFTLNWTPPSSNGGAAITDYVVEIYGGGFSWAPVSHEVTGDTSITVSGLNPGIKYTVRVKAVNRVGMSKSSTSLYVTTLATTPA